MKLSDLKYRNLISYFYLRNVWQAFVVLLTGLVLTLIAVYYTRNAMKEYVNQTFLFSGNEIRSQLDTRLRAHAMLLRIGAAFFAASDTVTKEEWRLFIENAKININLPGIEGIGFSLIIPKNQLAQHIIFFRNIGFQDYHVKPAGEREIYTSIIYLEPFSGRNLRAFGYDMYSEPIRRRAMEISRDSDFAMLSGKVILVQETDESVQAGSLMYLPVYRNGMKINSVEERRAAIRGWVYSPYRMDDLMEGVLGKWDLPDKNRIHLEIFDDGDISIESLLYDSQGNNTEQNTDKHNLHLILPVEFNGRKWTLQLTAKASCGLF